MCHGGISRARTFSLIALAQGRASSKVSNDIGAKVPGRWQTWHLFCRIGATSFVNVTGWAAVWAADTGLAIPAISTTDIGRTTLQMVLISNLLENSVWCEI